jgi:hypothetical protein
MVRDGAAGAGSGVRVPRSVVALSRHERRDAARDRATREFGDDVEPALDLIELLELAWHDTHGEITPPRDVLEDVWLVAAGDVGRLASASRLAVADRRDLRLAADEVRALG